MRSRNATTTDRSAQTTLELVVVDDRHAAAGLERYLESGAPRSHHTIVLTNDALLAMRLGRAGHDARLPAALVRRDELRSLDSRALADAALAFGDPDAAWATIDGLRCGELVQYTLFPKFIRAIRNLHALDVLLSQHDGALRLTLVGTGELTRAARLVANRIGAPYRRVRGGPLAALRTGFARIRSGRQTRWVNSDLRAIVLEPAFQSWLAVRGLIERPPRTWGSRDAHRSALIVTGDRFTKGLIERLRTDVSEVVVAGATLPGRQLFKDVVGAVMLESFGRPSDLVRMISAALRAAGRAVGLLADRRHHRRFRFGATSYWPLVRTSVALHLVAWSPVLLHTRRLLDRCLAQVGRARVLVSSDVTAHNRLLVEETRGRATSVSLQHGMLAEANGHSVVRTDVLAAWGAESERWYRERGPQHARFVVTGNAKFDALAARIRAGRRPRRAGAPFTVLVCTGFLSEYSVVASDAENLNMLDAAIAWAAGRDDVEIVHKLHPGEEPTHYEEAATALGWSQERRRTTRDESLYDLIETADVLVAGYSTTVLESLALGTPAVVFDPLGPRLLVRVDESPMGSIAFDARQLAAHLDRLRERREPTGEERDANGRFLMRYLDGLDGGGTDRLLALLRRA